MPERKKLANFAIAGAQEYKKQKLPNGFLYAEKKMDGQRGIIIVHNGVAKAYTKGGCRVYNAGHILKVIALVFEECMLDGEWLYKKDFNQTQSIVMTQSLHELRKGLTFNAFDMLTYKEWKSKKCKTKLSKRKAILRVLIGKSKSILKNIVKYVEHEVLYGNKKAMMKFMEERTAEGHEGGMFKNPDSFYSFKKNSDWLKLKPFIEDDFKIIGAVEGRPGKTGKYIGMLGALIVKGKINDKPIQFQTSGMKDKDRKVWWALHKKKKLVGLTIEVKHEGVTVNGAVRFPRCLKLKLDR